MYRTSASRLRALKERVSNMTLSRYASSSAVDTATKSSLSSPRALFEWLAGDKTVSFPSRDVAASFPPLDVPLKDVFLPPPLPDYVQEGQTKITTLTNGLKIASEASPGPTTSIGLFIDSGSVYEKPHEFGTSFLLERMSFKSTLNRSHLRVVRELEAIGGNMTSAATREQMSYTFDALKTYLPQMVELLIDTVRNPAFLDWEVNEQIKRLKSEVLEASQDANTLIMAGIHSAAYTGALANPLIPPKKALEGLNAKTLEQFVSENFTASRMVLAATGVDHEELVKYAEPLLCDLPSVSRPKEPQSAYVGGDFRHCAATESTSFALAFEVPGGWHELKDAMTITVFEMLMGGGGSFSSGGPGKGMYSRLYVRVLSRYPAIQSCSAFSSIYNNTGIFGITCTTNSDFVSEAVDIAVNELITVANPLATGEMQLKRAKQATKSAILMNLESRVIQAEDMGRQILTYGERKPVDQFLKAVDDVTLEDIASIVKKLISSPLTMASHGDVVRVPSYEAISSKFQCCFHGT